MNIAPRRQPAIVISDPRMMTGSQIRAARGLLRISARELAERASVGIATIQRAESTDDVPNINARTLAKIQAALEAGGVLLIDPNTASHSGGAGVRFKP